MHIIEKKVLHFEGKVPVKFLFTTSPQKEDLLQFITLPK